MNNLLKRFCAQQSGATAVEYALIAALITVVLVAAIGPLSVALTETFEEVANAIPQTVP
ncbi:MULTISPECIES: Flp family type IVb pilin [unclassified Phenylobacterium]|uniref:Flp family type IVb pilin n=1 Tax=unclassified Phenylobacterium TaxID=2640670 RepID=UPI0009E9F34B|nr:MULTISPECIES: Flp family type IVb pilin [unclassified Phenylobacterium]